MLYITQPHEGHGVRIGIQRLEHMSAAITCLRGELEDPTLRVDPVEIEEARWFPSDQLPTLLGLDVRELVLKMGLAGLPLASGRAEQAAGDEGG